jgi:RNA polymerase sigma factor (sigma-70 family)
MTREDIKDFHTIFDKVERKKRDFYFFCKTWDDVRVDVLTHIYQKYHLKDPNKEFGPWANTIIRRQVSNQIRNSCLAKQQENLTIARLESEFESFRQKEQLEKMGHFYKVLWSKLRYKDKKLLILKYKHKKQYKELAALLKYSDRMINYRLDAFRKFFKEQAKKYGICIRG